jgi:hypothetical protein
MSEPRDPAEKEPSRYAFNLTLAAVAGQVGCLTLVIILAALLGGLWLDSRLNSKPLFTIILMIGSVPVTLVLMFWVVRATTARIASGVKKQQTTESKEGTDRGETS